MQGDSRVAPSGHMNNLGMRADLLCTDEGKGGPRGRTNQIHIERTAQHQLKQHLSTCTRDKHKILKGQLHKG